MRYVCCHPLFDERKNAHRFSFRLKEMFDANGMVLESFEYSGTGEAEGEFKDVTLATLREDVAKYIGGHEVNLVGVRFGASLAFDYCVRGFSPVRKLILLSPVIEGASYINYLRRKQQVKNLMTCNALGILQDEGYENLEGYKTSVNLIEQIKGFSLIDMAEECSVKENTTIVQISQSAKLDPELTALADRLKISKKRVFFEHVKLPMFWERLPETDYTKLTQKVMEWCSD